MSATGPAVPGAKSTFAPRTRTPFTMTTATDPTPATEPTPLCEPCQGIQRNWRGAPGHAELRQGNNRKELHGRSEVTITGYFCDRCGAHWHYTNDKRNQRAGWSLAPD